MAYKICQNQLKLLPKIINDPLKWPNFYNIVTKWGKFVKSGLTVWNAKAQNESKSTATRYYNYQYHILTYLLACIKSPMGIFAHEQCDQMLECYKENRVTKFSKSSPKSCHSSFLKKGWFSKQPKTLSHIWDIFARKFVAKIFNFFPNLVTLQSLTADMKQQFFCIICTRHLLSLLCVVVGKELQLCFVKRLTY